MLELIKESPIQPIVLPLFAERGVTVFIKRDDLIHPFISGNKWRKLKYVLEEARAMGKNTLVSFGGAYSNHLVALACAGATFGFKTRAFVRGEEVRNHMLGLCQTWGMQLEFVSREAYRDKEVLYQSVASDHTFFIDEGGRGALAAKGCEEILTEAKGFSHVVCAVGTGTTLAGLIKAAQPMEVKVEGICVLKGASGIAEDIKLLTPECSNWTLHQRFHGGGYAKTSPELWTLIDQMASQTGLLFDQVYTGKMMQAVLSLVDESYFPKGSNILLVHTGGLLGLLSRYD
jgi:1-aminocyclopropane-1-carboxylate deaminase